MYWEKLLKSVEMLIFVNFKDYFIAHDVIGHDVIGDPVAPTDNSGLGLVAIQNRLAIHSLDKKLWPI